MNGGEGPAPTWMEIMSDLWTILSSPTLSLEDRQLIQDIIDFDGPLYMDCTDMSNGPHSKSPENMIKFLAEQAIHRQP